MWPKGSNCSFLRGISDYFEDIHKNQSSLLTDSDITHINSIHESVNKIIQKNTKSNISESASETKIEAKTEGNTFATTNNDNNNEPYSIESKVKVFFEWAQTYISLTDSTDNNIDWSQLVELFNFQIPDSRIPSNIDVTLYYSNFLYKYCKDKGNELMKNKKINSAIDMYSKAISLLKNNETAANDKDNTAENNETDGEQPTRYDLAIIYSNRSAAWIYLQKYENAINDAVCALKYDPLLTKTWIRKGMAEQELRNYRIAYGDYQVALNQSKESDSYYKFLNKKIDQCFDQIVFVYTQNQVQNPGINQCP